MWKLKGLHFPKLPHLPEKEATHAVFFFWDSEKREMLYVCATCGEAAPDWSAARRLMRLKCDGVNHAGS